MENQIRTELIELCKAILQDEQDHNLDQNTIQARSIYEKLIIVNHLKQNSPSAPSAAITEEVEDRNEAQHEVIQLHASKPNIQEEDDDVSLSPETIETEESKSSEISEPEAELPEVPSLDDEISQILEEADHMDKPLSINDRLAGSALTIGLNDRIAFVKHLFNEQQQDFNRVLSQLNTLESFEEAESFILNMIKPDYDWTGKEEYEARFVDLIRKRFGAE